ncbi:hypothetical protein [Dyadobacter sp. CY347]|uniref:hypothetical protein n=1 Tax=Dyadobacter sp. CY347 TaxID=2909336 RepID=UPI001F47212F|nr:hypothetical protein [Dyadobacter sp. CY347]MCF2490764.1 hypothetical protein [Dyadobacter sp. CY347]
MRLGSASVKLPWRDKPEGKRRSASPGAAADQEPMGKVSGVSPTQGGYQNDTFYALLPVRSRPALVLRNGRLL